MGYMRTMLLAILSAVGLAGCNRQTAQPPPATDPKERELTSLPVGIEVTHAPNPVKAQEGGRSGYPFTYVYRTTVKSTVKPLTVVEFGALVWQDGQWVFRTYTGKPFSGQDFAEWYACPKATLLPSQQYSDPANWSAANTAQQGKTKWYFIGVDDQGKRYKGEAIVEQTAEVAGASFTMAEGCQVANLSGVCEGYSATAADGHTVFTINVSAEHIATAFLRLAELPEGGGLLHHRDGDEPGRGGHVAEDRCRSAAQGRVLPRRLGS